MYSAREFGAMIADKARIGAYQRAIYQSVAEGDVVVDLGAGTGVLSLLACKAGAAHVYAIETNPLIDRGPALARANGFEDRITFVRGDALEFTPDREVNVVIGDVRGSLPTASGLELYRDAARYLAPGARVVPQSDEVFLAPLSHPGLYRAYVEEPWILNELGLDLTHELPLATAGVINTKLRTGEGLLEPKPWGLFDYVACKINFRQDVFDWQADEPTTLHFLALWFDTTLATGIGFSNAPGAGGPRAYGQIILPLEVPLAIEKGDTIHVRLRTNEAHSVWSWDTEVRRQGKRAARLQQSNLAALDLDAFRQDGVPA